MFPFCFRATETRYSLLPWTCHVSVMIPERKYDDMFQLHFCRRNINQLDHFNWPAGPSHRLHHFNQINQSNWLEHFNPVTSWLDKQITTPKPFHAKY